MIPLEVTVPETGCLRQLAEDLYWARFDLPFRLNHINLYMLDTPDGWCLIDAGVNDKITADHWDMLLSGPLSHQPVASILITHHHVDHMGFAGQLAQLTNAPVYTSADEGAHGHWLYDLPPEKFGQIMAQTYTRYDLPKQIVEEIAKRGSRYRKYAAPLPSFQILQAGDILTSRQGKWAVRIDKGHSDAQISLMDKQRNLFISIDFLLPRISPNISADIRKPDTDLLSHYFTYLHEMTALDEDIQIFPGHDWPFRAGGARAQALIAHHHQRLDMLVEAAQHNHLTVASAMDVLFGRSFGPHELYFASGEARAHLNHLVAIDRLCLKHSDSGYDFYETI